MNAKLLEHLVSYRENYRVQFAKTIICQKIIYQFEVISKRKESFRYLKEVESKADIKEILLVEARASREYFTEIKYIVKDKADYFGRKPHNKDVLNQLLDIGYHFLSNEILKIFNKVDIPTELGFFHKAQSKNSHPLVYDFIEIFRPVVVDRTVIHLLNKKKKKLEKLSEKDIKHFVYSLKKQFEIKFYNKKLKYCVTLNYWIELLLLNFENCIYKNKIYKPNFPSIRNENRCK